MQTRSDTDDPAEAPNRLSYQAFLLRAFLGIFVPLCAFDWLARAVSSQPSLAWENAFLRLLPASLTPALDRTVSLIALSGGIEVVVVLAVLGVWALKRLQRLKDAMFVTLAIVGVVVVSLLVRTAVQRAQLAWAGSSVPTFDFGFPSTQAADTFALALVAGVLAWRTRWRWLAVSLGTSYVLAVALSRVYLGLHYPSDILGGWALSLACVTAASFVRRLPLGSLEPSVKSG